MITHHIDVNHTEDITSCPHIIDEPLSSHVAAHRPFAHQLTIIRYRSKNLSQQLPETLAAIDMDRTHPSSK